MTLIRFSAAYYREKRSQEAVAQTRRAFEQQQKLNRRWRRRDPTRNPTKLLEAWNANKLTTTREYSALMVQFMSTFDGVSEANAMLRHGLEAPDAEIALESFHDLAFNTFTLRVFEILAEQVKLSDYSRQLVLQRMVPMIFAAPARTRAPFDMATVPLEGETPPAPRQRPNRR